MNITRESDSGPDEEDVDSIVNDFIVNDLLGIEQESRKSPSLNDLSKSGSGHSLRSPNGLQQDLAGIGARKLSNVSNVSSEDAGPSLNLKDSDESPNNSDAESPGACSCTSNDVLDLLNLLPSSRRSSSTQLFPNSESPRSNLNVFDTEAFLSEETRQHLQELCELIQANDQEGVEGFMATHAESLVELCLLSNEEGLTPITLAASLGHLEILKLLQMPTGTWLHCPDKSGYYPIHRAIMHNHMETVEYLAEQGQALTKTRGLISPLYMAANLGLKDIVTLLVDYANVDVNETLSNGRVALHAASAQGHAEVVDILLTNGAIVDVSDIRGQSSLCLAVNRGHTQVVMSLLREGADVNFKGPYQLNPLNIAIEGKATEMAKLLIENGANLDVPDMEGNFPLHKAIVHGNTELLDFILEKHPETADSVTELGFSGIVLAVSHRQPEAVHCLLQHHADPNKIDPKGSHALFRAVQQNSLELVTVLLMGENAADINLTSENGSTPLYLAAKHGYMDITAVLISAGADVNLARQNGWTPLHVAVLGNHVTIVEQLIAAGADPNLPDKQGQTSMAVAAHLRRGLCVRHMAVKCKDPVTVYKAAKLGNSGILKYMEKCGIGMTWKNSFGWTPMHYACQEGHRMAAGALLKVLKPADLEEEDSDGNTPLFFAVLHGYSSIAKDLLSCNVAVSCPNNKSQTCLSLAVQRKDEVMVKLLLQNGADIQGQNQLGETVLFHAIDKGCAEMVNLLIGWGADCNHKAKDSTVPIQHAVKLGHTSVVHMLQRHGAHTYAKDPLQNSLLHIAAQHGHLEVVLELVLAKLVSVNEENILGKTALQLAAEEGHAAIVEALLDAGTKLRALDSEGCVKYSYAKHLCVWNVLKTWANTSPEIMENDSSEDSSPQGASALPGLQQRQSQQPSHPSTSPRASQTSSRSSSLRISSQGRQSQGLGERRSSSGAASQPSLTRRSLAEVLSQAPVSTRRSALAGATTSNSWGAQRWDVGRRPTTVSQGRNTQPRS